MRCQQNQVYAAEEAVPTGTVFRTTAEAQRFMDSLRETWWWNRFYWEGPNHVEVYFRRSGMSVNQYDRTKDGALIELRPGQRNVKTLLHELAHILAAALFDSNAHDPFFARTYAVLVYSVLGSKAWLTLQSGYERHGVDYQKTRREA